MFRELPRPEGWNRTEHIVARLKNNPLYEEPDDNSPTGYFAGRFIIARDTPINGGVYLGAGSREAIVVDDTKYPAELDSAFRAVQLRMGFRMMLSAAGIRVPMSAAEVVYEVTINRLGGKSFDQALPRVEASLAQLPGDSKVSLNDFIRAKAGVCRHRALLVGYLLERMINEGSLGGRVSIDRSTEVGRGHAWVRQELVINNEDVINIIDPTLRYVGDLRKTDPSLWNYKRPEDR